jgi:hypothetical protein
VTLDARHKPPDVPIVVSVWSCSFLITEGCMPKWIQKQRERDLASVTWQVTRSIELHEFSWSLILASSILED